MLELISFLSCETGTFSNLFYDGGFRCVTLEPVVPGIPAGEWPVLYVNSPTWTPKMKHEMLWVAWKVTNPTPEKYNSPENENGHALLHPGNTIKDTSQCILTGAPSVIAEVPAHYPVRFRGLAYGSNDIYQRLYRELIPAAGAGELKIRINRERLDSIL